MKVMICGDSFGLPRPFKMNNGIELIYENTYPEQLRRMLTAHYTEQQVMLINHCKRAHSSLGILHDLNNPRYGEIYLHQPEIVVFQVGNVDCFERTKHHDEFAPFVEMRGQNPWISQDNFILYIMESVKKAFVMVEPLRSIIILNIPPISKDQGKAFESTRKRISAYNLKLKTMLGNIQNVHVVDIYRKFYKSPETPLSSDGIHPNKVGAQLMAEAAFDIIKEY